MVATGSFTVEDLARLDDGAARYDLIRGELIKMNPAGFRHGNIALRIGRYLDEFVEKNRLGMAAGAETGFKLGPDTVLAPDAAFVRTDRLPPESDWDGFIPVAPDLVVEIVSPSDRARYVMDKVMEYLDAGVRLVWIVEPRRRTVAVYRADHAGRVLTKSDTLDGEDVLPGFSLAVSELFRV